MCDAECAGGRCYNQPLMTAAPPTEGDPGLDVTVAILSWNARSYLRRCLASLYEPGDEAVHEAWKRAGYAAVPSSPERVSWETVVVDQESLDGSPQMVQAEFPQARLVAQKPNLGFAGGNNVAYRHTRGRYFLLLNSD